MAQPPARSSFGVFADEARLFLELAVPGTLLGVGSYVSPFLIASVVGLKFGETHLAAFTLANLTGNLFSYALTWGIFSAADTLGPQAFGKGQLEEVGLIALRGVLAASSIALAVNGVLFLRLERFLVSSMGQPPEASRLAQDWYRIFVIALPFVVVFNATWKLLSAQRVMAPLICVTVVSCAVVLPAALRVLTDRFGFLGSAWAYVAFQAAQCCLLLAWLARWRPHAEGTFPRLRAAATWRRALDPGPLREFVSLGGGGMLAQSEWIYWEALGLVIGRLGVLQLGAHTVPNQLIMVGCMAPFAFGTALAIRMGITLASSSSAPAVDVVKKTKKMVMVTTALSTAAFGVLSVWMYVYKDWICSLFTSSPEILLMLDGIWWKVCLFNFDCAFFLMFTGVATGLGMQWTLGVVNAVFLWVFGIPAAYHWTVTLGGGLDAAWTSCNVPYALINASLLYSFAKTDWYEIRDKILEGKVVQDPGVESATRRASEASTLLDADEDSRSGYSNEG